MHPQKSVYRNDKFRFIYKAALAICGLYDIRSHRQSRRSVSERTQPSIPIAQARLQGLQAYPQTLAGTTLQKPIWLFAYRSRGLETQAGIITSISCNSNQNRISLYE